MTPRCPHVPLLLFFFEEHTREYFITSCAAERLKNYLFVFPLVNTIAPVFLCVSSYVGISIFILGVGSTRYETGLLSAARLSRRRKDFVQIKILMALVLPRRFKVGRTLPPFFELSLLPPVARRVWKSLHVLLRAQ